MNRTIVWVFVFFCMMMQMRAQTMSEAEVSAKMTQAFELNKANRKAEALDLFLIVGENTKQRRNEVERQVYVCSQTMACQCYELLGRYKEGYWLAKELLQGELNAKERKDIAYLYALNGYMYACEFIKRNEKGQADYSRGRSILACLIHTLLVFSSNSEILYQHTQHHVLNCPNFISYMQRVVLYLAK